MFQSRIQSIEDVCVGLYDKHLINRWNQLEGSGHVVELQSREWWAGSPEQVRMAYLDPLDGKMPTLSAIIT